MKSLRAGSNALLALALVGCESIAVELGGDRSSTADGIEVGGSDDRGAAGAASVVCETSTRTTTLRPAVLAFAFDVSGSMGRLDCPFWNHDPTLKWRPVVEATTAFFESEAARGIRASMTLFPAASDGCSAASYQVPDVPLTPLPSGAFGASLDAYENEVGLDEYTDPMPEWGGEWRGGTPTHAVVTGTRAGLIELKESEPDSSAALVLVTDGMPAGCSDDVEHLADVIASVSDLRAAGIVTYVIGVREPTLAEGAVAPWVEDDERVWACKSNNSGAWLWGYDDATTARPPPDNLANLHTIAAAGGTERALLIDTGNPSATRAALQTAIDAIRRQSVPCTVEIPPQPADRGRFEPEKIDIAWEDGGVSQTLAYDPSCSPGGGWHYDDADAPSRIELCPETCATVQSSLTLEFRVDFLCEPRLPTPK